MQVNSTASYSPSYTANFGAAEQAKSKAATKVVYKPSVDPLAKAGSAEETSTAERAQKIGHRLNAKA